MKTIISIILIVIIAGVCTAVYLSGSQESTEISVLRDITETHLSQPLANEIIPLFGLDTHKWNGASFRFGNISDVSYIPGKEAKIGSANQWLANEYDRTKEIKKFYSDISGLLSNAQKDSIGKGHSSVYMPIAEELNRLSKSKSTKRILLVYSDLMENDPNFTFYDANTLNMLSSNPDIIKKKLALMLPFSNLLGIEIHLLYQPPDPQSDIQFKIVSGFYKQLLENKGATVSISANLQ